MSDYSTRILYWHDYPVPITSRIGKRVPYEAVLAVNEALREAKRYHFPAHTPYHCLVDDKNTGSISIELLCTQDEIDLHKEVFPQEYVKYEGNTCIYRARIGHTMWAEEGSDEEVVLTFHIFPTPTDTRSDYWSRDAYLHECLRQEEQKHYAVNPERYPAHYSDPTFWVEVMQMTQHPARIKEAIAKFEEKYPGRKAEYAPTDFSISLAIRAVEERRGLPTFEQRRANKPAIAKGKDKNSESLKDMFFRLMDESGKTDNFTPSPVTKGD